MVKFIILLLSLLLFNPISAYGYGGPSRIPLFATPISMCDDIGLLIGIDQSILDYSIKIDYDYTKVEILDPINIVNLGSFSFVKTDGSLTITDSGTKIYDKNNGLFFIPIYLKANINVPVVLRFTINNSQNANIYLKRGKIINDDSNDCIIDISTSDAIAGLQYLAGIRESGELSNQINLINMASILHSNKPNVKDVIALMQYLAGLRDDNLNLINN